ncbi:unnamed protein product, partial [Phaeothamnion confervicola]
AATRPFHQRAGKVPGVVQAERFDWSGTTAAYWDSEPENLGGLYRPAAGVDIVEAGGGDVSLVIGYTRPNEWTVYTVDVAADAEYDVEVRTSALPTPAGGAVGQLQLVWDGAFCSSGSGTDLTGGLWNVPVTGAWEAFVVSRVTPEPRVLTAGRHTLRLCIYGGFFNIDYVRFTTA